jgi:hypothetical protein
VFIGVAGRDCLEELDIVVRVILGHLGEGCLLRALEGHHARRKRISDIDFHLPVEPIVEQEVVCHANAMGLHGMARAIIIVANISWGHKRGAE